MSLCSFGSLLLVEERFAEILNRALFTEYFFLKLKKYVHFKFGFTLVRGAYLRVRGGL